MCRDASASVSNAVASATLGPSQEIADNFALTLNVTPLGEVRVRFGSKADVCSALGHVRFTPTRKGKLSAWSAIQRMLGGPEKA